MKIVPVICFALATAAAGTVLPLSPSYAQTYPDQAESCTWAGSPNADVGNCKANKEDRASQERSALAGHPGSSGHAASRALGK
jgi:hypothetical protein